MFKTDKGIAAIKLTKEQQSTLELKYVRIIKSFLSIVSLWPSWAFSAETSRYSRWFKIYVSVQGSVLLVAQITFLSTNIKKQEFSVLVHVYITCFVTSAGLIRIYSAHMHKYGVILRTFFTEFHLMHFKHKNNNYYQKIYNLVEKVSYYYTLFGMFMMLIGLILFNVSPAINNYRAGAYSSQRNENTSLDFSVFYTIPGFDINEHFYAATAWNYLLCLICSVCLCAVDGLLFIIVFQIIGHLVILSNTLNNLPTPQGKGEETALVFDEQENKNVHGLLVDIIEHHKQIVQFSDSISSFFGPLLAFNYFMQLVCCCMLLLACFTTEANNLLRYGPLTLIIFGQLIQVSVIFEVVGYVSEKLMNDVYCVPWECMSRGNRVAVALLLQRTQAPIRLTAMGLVPVGVETMTQILKTTFSTFALLKSFKD